MYIRLIYFGFSLYFILCVLVLTTIRIDFPGLNSPFEDAMLQQVNGLLNGQNIYRDADVHYVPLLYGPGYIYVGAISVRIFGESMLANRIPAIGAILLLPIIFFRIFTILNNKKNAIFSTLLAIGILLAFYEKSGYTFDTAKVDFLFLLFTALILYYSLRLIEGESVSFYNLVLLVFASFCALITKQAGLVYPIVLFVLLIFLRKIRIAMIYLFLLFVCIFLFLKLPGTGLGDYVLDYTLRIPQNNSYNIQGVWEEFFLFFTPSVALVLLFLSPLITDFFKTSLKKFHKQEFLTWIQENKKEFLLFCFFIAGFAVSLRGRMKSGAQPNSFLYVFMFFSIINTILFNKYILDTELKTQGNFRINRIYSWITGLLVFLQFLVLFYSPLDKIRTTIRQNEKVAEYQKALCAVPGPVFTQFYSYMGKMHCGWPTSFAYAAAIDLIDSPELFQRFRDSFIQSFGRGEFPVFLDVLNYKSEEINANISQLKTMMAATSHSGYKKGLNRSIQAMELEYFLRTKYELIPEEKYTPEESALVIAAGSMDLHFGWKFTGQKFHIYRYKAGKKD